MACCSPAASPQVSCSWRPPTWALSGEGKPLASHDGVASAEEGLLVGISPISQLDSRWGVAWVGGNLGGSAGSKFVLRPASKFCLSH